MPSYLFKCPNCEHQETSLMEIKVFLENRFNRTCSKCSKGPMNQVISDKLYSKVERTKNEILPFLKEEARKIVQKIEAGDERAINDIYGESPNSLK